MPSYPGVNRQTGKGPYRHMTANWKAAVAVDVGDLVYQDPADTVSGAPYDKPAGSVTWTTDLLTTQRLFAPLFRGVSEVRRVAGQTTAGTQATDGALLSTGEFSFPCAALGAAVIAGTLVTVAKATGNALDPKKVVATTDPTIAIGRVTEAAAVGATRLTFELLPPTFGGPLTNPLYGTPGILSAASAITASATSDQAGATQLAAGINVVSTVGTAGDSVKLPAAVAGTLVLVKNTSANSMDVFPATGDAINALSANAAYAVATVKAALFFCAAAGTWHTILTA
jgi:hypothetical protein